MAGVVKQVAALPFQLGSVADDALVIVALPAHGRRGLPLRQLPDTPPPLQRNGYRDGDFAVRRVPFPHQALGTLQGGQQTLVVPDFLEA